MTKTTTIKKLLEKAWKLRGEANYKESQKFLSKAESLCTKEDFHFTGRIHHIRMQYEADKDNFDKAMEYCQLSVLNYIKSKDYDRVAHSVRHLADLQFEMGELKESESNYIKSIGIYKSLEDCNKGDLANALRGYAQLQEKKGEFSEAMDLWQEIIHLYKECNFKAGEIEGIEKLNQLRNRAN